MMAMNKNKSVILKPRAIKIMAKIEIATMPKELMILLPAITEATLVFGAFFCISAFSGTTYKPPIKAKPNKHNANIIPRGIHKNCVTESAFSGVVKPAESKYTQKAKTLKPIALTGT